MRALGFGTRTNAATVAASTAVTSSLPTPGLLFHHVERVSLRKLSSRRASLGRTTPDATTSADGAQSLERSRHPRRTLLIRHCLRRARAYALAREMERAELVERYATDHSTATATSTRPITPTSSLAAPSPTPVETLAATSPLAAAVFGAA
ncbi:hypothetical protein THASP1DRAFT_33846, partial [Thamnocephalis sphaerospora]